MNRIRELIVEAHRRSLWQVLSIYLAASYGVFQLVDLVTNYMGLPGWVPGFALVLILIGLPVVLATAFVQEGGPGLRAAPSEAGEPAKPVETAPPKRRQRLFTWKKAALGGVGALLLLSVTAGGYMGLRAAGIGPFGSLVASGAVDAREPILIAEFDALNGDTSLAMAVTEAFRVDFAQTSIVSVFEPRNIGDVLRRMGRDAGTRVDGDLAHEVALRANVKTYVTGELGAVGGRFVVTGKLVSTRDQRVLATYRETARDSSEILDAIDRLSKKLRERLGESLKATRIEKPLQLVSTPSLEALQKYSEGARLLDREGNDEQAIALLKQALELDSTFAMAWRKLSAAYFNGGAPPDMVARAARRAYELRDHLTDIERYEASGSYFYMIGDFHSAVREWELLAARDPSWLPTNLGVAYMEVHELDKAERALRRVIEADSTRLGAYGNLATVLWRLGQDDEIETLLQAFERHLGDSQWFLLLVRSNLALLSHDYETSQQYVTQAVALEPRSTRVRSTAAGDRFIALTAQGRYAAARQAGAEYNAVEQERRPGLAQLELQLMRANVSFFTRNDPARAAAELDAALREQPLAGIPALDRPYAAIARLYALTGAEDRARALWAEYKREVPADLRASTARDDARLEGAIAFGRRAYDEALEHWRRAASLDSPCQTCMDSEMALAFQGTNQPDSAIARYEHYINTRDDLRTENDVSQYAAALERLAELHDAKGDAQNAARYAARFVEMWQHADAELQPRVAAKRRMLEQVRR